MDIHFVQIIDINSGICISGLVVMKVPPFERTHTTQPDILEVAETIKLSRFQER